MRPENWGISDEWTITNGGNKHTPCRVAIRRNGIAKGPAVRRLINKTGLSLVAILACAIGGASLAVAEPAEDRRVSSVGLPEYSVKAAFVYNFARFTEWPDTAFHDANSPLRLCVLGQDPFDGALGLIAGKTIGNRELLISYPIWADDAQGCHILFISESVDRHLSDIVAYLSGFPVLTIGDTPDIARSGGIIGLETIENRIRFRVNLDAAQRSGLRLSSRILDLATSVHSERLSGSMN